MMLADQHAGRLNLDCGFSTRFSETGIESRDTNLGLRPWHRKEGMDGGSLMSETMEKDAFSFLNISP